VAAYVAIGAVVANNVPPLAAFLIVVPVFAVVARTDDVLERIEQWDRIVRVTVAANP